MNRRERFLVNTVFAAAMPIALINTAAHRAVKKAKDTIEDHPLATTLVAGTAGGVVLAAIAVDGDAVHPNSLYAKTKNALA